MPDDDLLTLLSLSASQKFTLSSILLFVLIMIIAMNVWHRQQ